MKQNNIGIKNTELLLRIHNLRNQDNQQIYKIDAETAPAFSCIIFSRYLEANKRNPISDHMDRCLFPGRDQIIADVKNKKMNKQVWLIFMSLARTLERRTPGGFMKIMAPGIHDLCKSSSYLNTELVTAFYEYVLESIKY
ncbi:MAG: hypothetical protein WC470_03220 [Candidatus Paceibacterota bacterium]